MKIEAKFLGQLDFFINDISIVNKLSKKSIAILSYLLINRKVHFRETISGMFWNEFNIDSSRRNLRHSIWEIRKTVKNIDDSIDIFNSPNKNKIQFNNKIKYISDLKEFEKYIEIDLDLTLDAIDFFLNKFKYDFFEGFYIIESQKFNDWIYFKRNEIKKTLFDYLFLQANKISEKNKNKLSLKIYNELILIDQYNENLYLKIMELYIKTNNKIVAMNVYKKYKFLIREDLNISPGVKIKKYYDSNFIYKNKKQSNIIFEKIQIEKNYKFCFYIGNSFEDAKKFRKVFLHEKNKKNHINLTMIPGRRLPYEGIFEMAEELNLITNKKSNKLIKLINQRLNHINEYELFIEFTKYLKNDINEIITVIIYNLDHLDEKTIDFLSFVYRQTDIDKMKFHIFYNKNFETNRIRYFINAIKNEENVKIIDEQSVKK
ncbi:MAG: hypothetical protein U9N10_06770 [Bacillota bacterium]|nr:hypothetical protein [Bacillota bacterium]